MVNIEFNFNQKIINIQANLDEPFKIAVDKYIQKTSIDPTSVYFLANGKILNLEQTIKSQMTEINKKNKKLSVLVTLIANDKSYDENVIIKSKDIICPKCYEPCRLKMQNYEVILFGCINNHTTEDIKFTKFNETQKINISKIICDNCKIKNLGNCPNDEFYYCLSCKVNLCLLCKPHHNQNHNIIKYSQKNYICLKHNEAFDEYCEMCNMNICFSCLEHIKHKTISLREFRPYMEKTKRRLSEIKSEVETFKNNVKEIIKILDNLVKTMDAYYEINYDIINNYEIKNRNYQNLKNLEELDNNNDILEKLKKVNQAENIKDKIIDMIDISELNNKVNSQYEDNNQKIIPENETNLQNNILINQKDNSGNKIKELKLRRNINRLDNNKNNILMSNISLNIPNKNINRIQLNNSNIIENNFNINSQSEQKNIKSIKSKKPLDLYREPTLIGLQNIGAASFINAILQCLSQTTDLTNYFLDEDLSLNRIINNNIAIKNKKELQLSPIYLELVKNLWNKNKIRSYYNPIKFIKVIEQMNPIFKKDSFFDLRDFIIFILERLHEELKHVRERNASDNYSLQDRYDAIKAFNNFVENFKGQSSIIVDIFFGINESRLICLNCKNNYSKEGKAYPISYVYSAYNFLIFPLEKVRKYRNNNMNQYKTLTLEDCFLYNQRIELMTGDNQYWCNICKQSCDANCINNICSFPNVLILILKRERNNCFDLRLDFKETIDITDFVSIKISKIIYNLYGVVTQIGNHFLAFCKSPINNKWHRYNDTIINEVKNFKNEVIDFGEPNILFYKLQK